MKTPGTRPAGKTMINFINKILTRIFGSTGDRVEKELSPVVEQVNSETMELFEMGVELKEMVGRYKL